MIPKSENVEKSHQHRWANAVLMGAIPGVILLPLPKGMNLCR